MNYLLDTNVLSEVRRPRPEPAVLEWLDSVDEERLHLSVITIAELARGIALMPMSRRKTDLAAWLETDLQLRFGRRLIGVDGETAFAWGHLMAVSRQVGRNVSVMDCWIAAIAMRHGLCVATRNVRDFENLGVDIFDPWDFRK